MSLSRTEWSGASCAFSDETTLHSGAVGTFSGGSAACSACGFAGASVSCGGVGSSFGCSPASAEATSSTGSLSSDESELTLTEPAASDEADSILPEDTDPVDTSLPDDTTASASSTVSLLSSSSYTFVSPRARTFSLKMLGSTATSLIETQSSMPVYGWDGSTPTKDESVITYTTVSASTNGSLSPIENTSYTLSGALTGLNADGFDIKLSTGNNNTIRSINIASSGNWTAGSVWLSQGIFNVVNLPEGSVGALYAINSRLHINKDNGVIGSVIIKPETLFIGGRSYTGNNSAYALNDATLSAAMDCEVGGGVKVLSETKIAVHGGAVLTFSQEFDADGKSVYFAGSGSSDANGFIFKGNSTIGAVGISVVPSTYGNYVGDGVVLTFNGGTSTIGALEMQTRNSSYRNGLVIGGGSEEAMVTITGAITATGGANGANIITVENNGRLILGAGTDRIFADGVIATTVNGTLRNEGNLNIAGALSGSGVIENTGILNFSGSNASVATVKNTGTLKVSDSATLTARSSDTAGIISNATFSYDRSTGRAVIAGGSMGTGRIENTLINVAAGATLELSNMVLADTVKITDDTANFVSSNNVVELGAGNSSVGTRGELNGVTLNTTGTTTAAKTDVSGNVYIISFSGIQDVSITGTLTFDFSDYSAEVGGQTLTGFDLFRELGKEYAYIAIEFVGDGTNEHATLQYENLTVKARVDGVPAISTGYYSAGTASGVLVYFDSIALPEPTTATLTLMALSALCARRRRRI